MHVGCEVFLWSWMYPFDTLSLSIHCINLSLKAINYAVELTVHMGVTVLGRVHWRKLLLFCP